MELAAAHKCDVLVHVRAQPVAGDDTEPSHRCPEAIVGTEDQDRPAVLNFEAHKVVLAVRDADGGIEHQPALAGAWQTADGDHGSPPH